MYIGFVIVIEDFLRCYREEQCVIKFIRTIRLEFNSNTNRDVIKPKICLFKLTPTNELFSFFNFLYACIGIRYISIQQRALRYAYL